MPCVHGYLRQAAGDASCVASQTEALRRFAAERLPGFVWQGAVVDAPPAVRQRFSRRLAGIKLVGLLQRGDALVIARLDTAFRDSRDFLDQMRVWSQCGIAAHVLEPAVDNVSAPGRHLLSTAAAMQAADRGRAAERARAAWKTRRAKGRVANQYAGYGFRLLGRKGSRRAVPDPKERAVMQAIVEWREQGRTWEQIYWHLLRHDITTRSGRTWSCTRIQRAYAAELKLQTAGAGAPQQVQGSTS